MSKLKPSIIGEDMLNVLNFIHSSINRSVGYDGLNTFSLEEQIRHYDLKFEVYKYTTSHDIAMDGLSKSIVYRMSKIMRDHCHG
ncbi:MAG: hypothetical protein AABY15_07030 [Nanoarchaeota archaeon]